MKTKEAIFLPAALILICIVFVVTFEGGSKRKKKQKKEIQEISEIKKSDQSSSLSTFFNVLQSEDESFSLTEIQNYVSLLQEEESKTIHTHTGIHSVTSRIESFCKQLVIQKNPNFFNNSLFMNCFEEMVKATFPEKQEEINIYYKNLIQYRLVLESENSFSDAKTKSEREDAVWTKRYELFGFSAAEELYASEKYLKNIQQKINTNASSKKSLEEKINFLQKEIAFITSERQNEQYPIGEEFIQFGEFFLSSPEVQSSLLSMPLEIRSQKLRTIRLAVGIPENRVKQLEDLDRNRAEIGEKGKQYLKEMNALKEKSEMSAEEFNLETKKLKESFFGKELADEIEDEEKKGINRFANTQEFFLQ